LQALDNIVSHIAGISFALDYAKHLFSNSIAAVIDELLQIISFVLEIKYAG